MAVQFVPAIQEKKTVPINANMEIIIDAPLSATQHVEMRTSAVDRSVGFLISSIPLFFVFALCIVALVVLGWGIPLLSLPMLAIFLLSFTAAWLVAYGYTLSISAEGVSLHESVRKWNLIEKEHDRRWERINNEQ